MPYGSTKEVSIKVDCTLNVHQAKTFKRNMNINGPSSASELVLP